MSENILVVEYEPRYTDRVRQALAGQPFTMTFARDGEEAMKALDGDQPRLIVLSSVVPKVSTTELIRAIRGRKPLQETPILLTVSGYNGKSPKADAQRVGASDILPKPYSETEFLGKVQQMLGIRVEAASSQFTSNEIFGDLVDDKPVKKTTASRSGDVDKMLADTLAGMNVPRKKEAPPAPAPVKARTNTGELDKRFQDTLSGLEKNARKTTSGGNVPVPPAPVATPVPAPAATPAPPRFNTEKMSAYVPDRVPVAQPVFTPAPEPAKVEEEEPTDGTKFGQYVLVEKIATGGMAEVWKARMRGVEGFQKIVAIKKILPHLSDNQDFIEMFVDEAKLAAQLNHNNIIHIYDLGKIQTSYYIAMEYIDGFDLKTILRQGQERDNPLNVELALFIASKIASALDYAHRKKDYEDKEMGLVHRDVSPQNVLISQEGDIKLCDFGIAKAASKASHTQAGALKGKLQYMAPEQAWGRNIDRRSDVFALATVLFEMLTNRKLFSGDNEISILEQVREAQVQPPSLYNDEVTPEIDKIVLKALQKDPANRYQTAGEMARDLDQVLYSFRPTPTSADLAIYMHRLSSPDAVIQEPEPFEEETITPAPSRGFSAPVIAPAAAVAAAASPAFAPVPAPMLASAPAPAVAAPPVAEVSYGGIPERVERKSKAGLIAAALALIAVGGGAAYFMSRKPAATAAQRAPVSTVAAGTSTAAPAALTTASLTDTSATAPLTATTAGIDPSAVDAEVQKRIAAERARLEALARQQGTAPPPATATTAVAGRPVPAPPQVAQQTPPPTATAQPPQAVPAPAPVQQQPQAPATQPEVAETRPAPAQQPAPAQRAREGELVAPGTDGLVNPRVLRRGTVPYPSMARQQKVEGTVITNVLVSETGNVLEVRIVRGISRGGLNEAAVAAMRRSSFAPGTKDGVKVKSWVTVPVEFKL
ncbi:MAG: eukaryotic-like serine/threonine-protein kinase [Acidobacteriota bacterium]|nr:eukaryotic-like serine/threonine-protein kinase [Acidobacteriota bacterium]